MNNIIEKQLELASTREKLLSLMIDDMKVIKNYLREFKELGKELRNHTRSTKEISARNLVTMA